MTQQSTTSYRNKNKLGIICIHSPNGKLTAQQAVTTAISANTKGNQQYKCLNNQPTQKQQEEGQDEQSCYALATTWRGTVLHTSSLLRIAWMRNRIFVVDATHDHGGLCLGRVERPRR
jgi:hypothetical protein